MKSRRVMFTVEVESNESVETLESNLRMGLEWRGVRAKMKTKVFQIQVDVIKPKK